MHLWDVQANLRWKCERDAVHMAIECLGAWDKVLEQIEQYKETATPYEDQFDFGVECACERCIDIIEFELSTFEEGDSK